MWEAIRKLIFDNLAERFGVIPYQISDVMRNTDAFKLIELFDEYDLYTENSKKSAPIRYFMFKGLPDILEYVYKLPENINEHLYAKYVYKRHIVDTGLKPNYYDSDEILVNAVFSVLVDFVECDCGRMESVYSGAPFKNRSKELGIKYINDIPENYPNKDHMSELLKVYQWLNDGEAGSHDVITEHLNTVIKCRSVMWV